MSSSVLEINELRAIGVTVTPKSIAVALSDGREIRIPLEWYPRLASGTKRERNHFRLIGDGEGIHWADLDEDISVQGLVAGKRSAESRASFDRWLAKRRHRKPA